MKIAKKKEREPITKKQYGFIISRLSYGNSIREKRKWKLAIKKCDRIMSKINLLMMFNTNILVKYLGERYSSHSFRIGLITKIMQKIVGHKNTLTTYGYIKPTDEDMAHACEVI